MSKEQKAINCFRAMLVDKSDWLQEYYNIAIEAMIRNKPKPPRLIDTDDEIKQVCPVCGERVWIFTRMKGIAAEKIGL